MHGDVAIIVHQPVVKFLFHKQLKKEIKCSAD
jgi:hypothetical protein